ncbi:MAG: selenocysteine-specific translation elongation factor [Candidatus Schekmanbacteria bacterium]|nr:selenocysteine-specific translation elongation factor [Candidatus Schekmanbacteria bacterium]
MKHLILGTAGHVDHGKTALVKALTGVDTDRLKEEKERGITIDLGFAALPLADGHLAVIDVPGHERFVTNMLAGTGGIDLVLLVVAADEGVMPQTREHLLICENLAVKGGVVVLTKCDLADDAWISLVKEDVRALLAPSRLAGLPIVAVSALTGAGLDELRRALGQAAAACPPKQAAGILFRMPIDRVFTMHGHGTVATGTVVSGSVSVGDAVACYPAGKTSRVRAIQVHGQRHDVAHAGQRCALNLPELTTEDLERGHVLSEREALMPSYLLDVALSLAPAAKGPVEQRARLRFHLGTAEIYGRLILLDRPALKPGESALAQLHLESPVAAVHGDRFVARTFSPIRTLGGGVVLDPAPQKHRPGTRGAARRTLALLAGMAHADGPARYLEHCLGRAGYAGIAEAVFARSCRALGLDTQAALARLQAEQIAAVAHARGSAWIFAADRLPKVRRTIADRLEAFHARYPLRPGMPHRSVVEAVPQELPGAVLDNLLEVMAAAGEIVRDGDMMRRGDFAVELSERQRQALDAVREQFRSAGLAPPDASALLGSLAVAVPPETRQQLFELLIAQGELVRLSAKLVFHRDCLARVETAIRRLLSASEELPVAPLKSELNLSRKYLIPLLEHFDAMGLTRRAGEGRVRGPAFSASDPGAGPSRKPTGGRSPRA